MPIQQILLGSGGGGEKYFIGVFGTSSYAEGDFSSPKINIDSSGNIYLTTMTYYGLNGVTPSGVILKYDKNGTLQWQNWFHLGAATTARAIDVDSSGNIYVAGYTTKSVQSQSGNNGFLAKYNSSGATQWVRTIGNTVGYSDYFFNLKTISSTGTTYVIGESPARKAQNVGTGWTDMLIAKYDSSGNVSSSDIYYHGGNGSYTSGWSIAVDTVGNYYPMGYISSGSTNGIYVEKFNTSHQAQWQRHLYQSGYYTRGQGGVAVDPSSGSPNVYVCGDTNYLSTGTRDMVIVKLNSSGGTVWQRYLGIASRAAYGRDIDVDSSGNVYAIGYGSVDYQNYQGYTSTMNTIIIVKYNSSGNLQWKRYLGVMIVPTQSGQYTDVEEGRSIKVDPTGTHFYVSGITKNGNFGYGDDDGVWAKLPTDGSLTGTYSRGSGYKDIVYGDATNLTDKAGLLTNNSYTDGYGTLSMNAADITSFASYAYGGQSKDTVVIS